MAPGRPRSPTCCRKGDKILVLESGRFAIGWGEHARRMGVEVEMLKGDMRRAVRPAEVEARLKADEGQGGSTIKAVLVAQIDTASGVVNDIAAIGQAIRAAGHDALLMVDAVASLGCMPFEMDEWGVDVAMSGSQKGLMTPPGLGFVAANDRAREVHKKAGLRTPYWDWTDREGDAALPEICRHAARASAVRRCARRSTCCSRRASRTCSAATGCWPKRCAARSACGRKARRSASTSSSPASAATPVTCVLMNGHDPEALRAYCNEKCGVILGHGIGELSGKAFRIAHMGHVNAPMILGTLSVIEMALAALEFRTAGAARRPRSTGWAPRSRLSAGALRQPLADHPSALLHYSRRLHAGLAAQASPVEQHVAQLVGEPAQVQRLAAQAALDRLADLGGVADQRERQHGEVVACAGRQRALRPFGVAVDVHVEPPRPD